RAPFPPRFTEKLCVYLSRYCVEPYCVLRHAAFLCGSGYVAGDPDVPPLQVSAVVALLNRPRRTDAELSDRLERLAGMIYEPDGWPIEGGQQEQDLFEAAAALGLRDRRRAQLMNSLVAVLGQTRFDALVALLDYVNACHLWSETHPLSLDADVRELLSREPDLRFWFESHYGEEVLEPDASSAQGRHLPELERVRTLRSYRVLDTTTEREFDEQASLAREMCKTPMACVTFVDDTRLWFKACVGTDMAAVPREDTFCESIVVGQEALMVEDLRRHPRFSNHPWVTAEPWLRFYAGAPIMVNNGACVGTVCVMSCEPHTLAPAQMTGLRTIADNVGRLIELRRASALVDRIDGLLARCAWCGDVNVRAGSGTDLWLSADEYFGGYDAVTHGICPKCSKHAVF
ncbi:MAG: GAF domain-containing protein, partial [Pseudomonadota bacterium]